MNAEAEKRLSFEETRRVKKKLSKKKYAEYLIKWIKISMRDIYKYETINNHSN